MKKIILSLFFLLGLISQYTLSPAAQDIQIQVAGDKEKKGGYLAEITEQAFRRVGYAPEFNFVPWARALGKSIEGEYDVLLAAYYTAPRAEMLAYTEPIGTTRVYLLKRKGQEISYQSLEDLKPYTIGHIRGSKVSKEFDAAEENFLHMEYVSTTSMNIRKLLAGRIDLVVEKEEQLLQLLRTEFKEDADKLEFLQPPLKLNKYFNAVSRKLPNCQQIVADFNRGFRLIQGDGTLNAILEKYRIPLE